MGVEKELFSSIPVDGKRRNTSGLVEALQQWGGREYGFIQDSGLL